MRTVQAFALIAAAGLSATALAGCSGSSDSSASASPTPVQSTTQPASPTSTGGAGCSEDTILAALPTGSDLIRYDCSDVSGTQWAAAEVNPGPTVFFLQESGGSWQVSTSDEICGTASAGLPTELLDYCNLHSESPTS